MPSRTLDFFYTSQNEAIFATRCVFVTKLWPTGCKHEFCAPFLELFAKCSQMCPLLSLISPAISDMPGSLELGPLMGIREPGNGNIFWVLGNY